jgi:hypothetical protein
MSSVVKDAITGGLNPIDAGTDRTQRTGYGEAPTQRTSMDKFVAEQNISRFVDQFQIAHGPHTRQTLQKLMLEEENKFGLNSERLEKIQQWIKECKARVGLHERLVNKARINGHDVAASERVLNNLIELQEIFWRYHQVVLEAVNRSKL